MSTPAAPSTAALRARGHQITLADGSRVTLRYSMLSLADLEERFGTVTAAAQQVQRAASALAVSAGKGTDEDRARAEGYTGPGVFSLLIEVLRPGLIGQRAHLGGQAVEDLAQSGRALGALLDPARLQEYVTAFGRAFAESLDAGSSAAAGLDGPGQGERPDPPVGPGPGSPSRTGTPTPADGVDVTTPPSGP